MVISRGSVAPPASDRPWGDRGRGRASRWSGALVSAGAVLLVAPAVASGASISGTVSDASGAPITTGDVCVTVNEAEMSFPTPIPVVRTGADGRYAVTGLRARPHRVSFADCDGSSRNDVGQWYGGAQYRDADVIVLRDGEDRTGIDARLAAGVSITGTAYADDGTTMPAGLCVQAQDADAPTFPAADAVGGLARTGSDGRYRIDRVPPLADGYAVRFGDCVQPDDFTTQFYGGDHRYATATAVRPSVATPSTGVDAHLVRGGVLTGTVRTATGEPRNPPVCVSATEVPDGPDATAPPEVYSPPFGFFSSELVDGRYRITGVPTGRYRVSARPCGLFATAGFLPAVSDPVAVRLGETADAPDLVLRSGTTISGTIRDATVPTAGRGSICVRLLDAATGVPEEYVQGGTTSSTGEYTLTGVDPDGTYKVEFDTCRRHAAGQGRSFYGDTDDLARAPVVTASVAQPATGIDGRIGGPDPTGLPYITGGPGDGGTSTDPRGRFTFATDGPTSGVAECLVDGAIYAFCSSPFTTPRLPDGPHTFAVRPWNATGPGASRTWTVQTATTVPDPPVDTPGDGGPTTGTGSGGGPPAGNGGGGQPAPGGGLTGLSLLGPTLTPPTTNVPPRPTTPTAPTAVVGRMAATRLGAVLSKGLRVPVTCTAACVVRAAVRVDGRTARRLGLARRATPTVVATGTLRGTTRVRTLTARYTAKARKALRRTRSVRFTVALAIARGAVTERTLTVHR